MTTLTLPNPPPLNNLFFNRKGGGRAKSERYMTWLNAAGWMVKKQRPKPVPGPIRIAMSIGPKETTILITPTENTRPKGMKADQDNLLKAPLDLLVEHGLIDDDRMVQALDIRWAV